MSEVKTAENTERVQATGYQHILSNPQHIEQIAAVGTSLSPTLSPPQNTVVYKPLDLDFASRSTFYEQFVTLVNADSDVIYCLNMTDETHFELSGCMYKQNMPF